MIHSAELLKWHCRPAVEIPLRYARRLSAMGPAEIAARLLHEKWAHKETGHSRWDPPGRQSLAAALENRFLFGATGARHILENWQRSDDGEAARFIKSARRGLGNWEIFGKPICLAPGEIDWHAGDLRWVWELNRHPFLFTFARAFLLTADAAYAHRIVALVEDWIDHNPFGCGVNWSSALEVALRAISWLWTLPMLLEWEELAPQSLQRWLRSLGEHYEYLQGHLSIYTDRTNHLIGEAAALWMLSIVFPSLPDARRQERRALEILACEIERQITPDGVSREQSIGYQKFVLDFCLQVLAMARRAGRELPAVIEQRTGAVIEFLSELGGEDGNLPAMGDSDDGRGVPFAAEAEELSLWLGSAPLRSRLCGGTSFSGYCLFRTEDGSALLFDVGPLGLWPNASHGHADSLSVQVKLGGRWFLGDPGTGSYAACPLVRDSLRGTAAHNTVTVDNMNQADALDVFKWLKPVPVRLLESYSGPDYEYALAVHEGYRRLRDPVTHYRAVLFRRSPPCWTISDRLEGTGPHDCALRFHFPPRTQLRITGTQALAIDPSDGTGLKFIFSDACSEDTDMWSSRFGQWQQAPVLVVRRKTQLPLSWLTCLRPLRPEET